MRSIKFRGKVRKTRPEIAIGKKPEDGTWVVGDLHYLYAGHPHIHFGLQAKISIDPDTIGQYTGLKDKNGKEIYEGDIIQSTDYPFMDEGKVNYLGIVSCDTHDSIGEFYVMLYVTKKSERRGISNFTNKSFYELQMENVEVVGNIYDNKGLFRDTDEQIMKWFKED